VLIGGVILPHPPILLPTHAGHRGAEVEPTIDAVQHACRWLAEELRPDRLHIASPHLGHGFDVPLHFIGQALGDLPPAERLLTADESCLTYRRLGEELAAREADDPGRAAIVASGDCSHRLRPGGPDGFHPAGKVLDAAIRAAVVSGRVEKLLEIEPGLIEAGAECGLRAFVFALAALRPQGVRILSYEAPYAVGYLVAELPVAEQARIEDPV
jgi:aromatic ring-opening dioxygenase LigB subunit